MQVGSDVFDKSGASMMRTFDGVGFLLAQAVEDALRKSLVLISVISEIEASGVPVSLFDELIDPSPIRIISLLATMPLAG